MSNKKCVCVHELTADEKEKIKNFGQILDDYKGKPGALIPVLQIAQKMIGYLPGSVLKMISKGLHEPLAKVYGVATFYHFFTMMPRGKHLIRICLGTACYVRGSKEVLAAFKKELGIDVGGTTADRKFTLEIGRCFGACGLAPVIMVNDDTHQRVKPSKIKEILAQYK
ncbi:NADH:ubiquinone oxidoreductase [candidate division WOR-1 bacterium RIFOXYA12_FULL_43_27]|uniref:NADH:ubiquinone oxidoreductase n=1 Tax=candidate division WOR-1 bacterium RIFOXYC2_FULL_46_14 TaxID=1802587 RepID=A0A1F4U7D2_UNCSA|nr:MAG: NADH:ubiquinone oxidoreductase [candidate division WOR-1 bacterium RIFOXYA12_FULL_43_27]OGC20357.1 MAG: NADH:ubiquinone oxidoreductase [candidate division WOR-1 bacterium RIFOXYB2_FULL_46_45]OGC31906.1 MAG: NADH:ubiquinone oxidoreductase [candidate division WOR-1 bacterium RIFOXYA2_FULL_46_56]OGC40203.1 MAG: NADH:ubiquinone oxidoreductase [candidate division WOR-1 bacterium RIFOXYC2_FULL_46_14]